MSFKQLTKTFSFDRFEWFDNELISVDSTARQATAAL